MRTFIINLLSGIALCFLLTFSTELKAAPYSFQEIWAYVLKGEENHLKGSEPISDLAYFSAAVNELGRLSKIPDPSKIPEKVRSDKRLHLVISTPSNISLMYWCLSKDQETRKLLIEDILKAAEPFDGLQIDFETVRVEESQAYLSFLKELKTRLPSKKIFSVAVPARTAEKEDAFNYSKIAAIADRVLVMAYDEHWRTGSPGAIASLPWCKKVFLFSKKMIPTHKLVMGIPLYGRVWQKQEVARALKYPETLALWKKHPSPLDRTPDGTPYFEYEETVNASVYFEDVQSLKSKIAYYEEEHLEGVGFWRVTQEPNALWSLLRLE